jgi:hypothetical protein
MDRPDDAPTLRRRDPARMIGATLVRFLPPIALGLAIAGLLSFGFVSVVLHLYEAGAAPTSADPRAVSLLSLLVNVVLLAVLVAAERLSRWTRDGTRER